MFSRVKLIFWNQGKNAYKENNFNATMDVPGNEMWEDLTRV